jgi:hypothetical protein
MDGMLLQTVEGLGDAPMVPTGGEIWEWLQGEKEEVAQELLSEGPLCQTEWPVCRRPRLRKKAGAKLNGDIADNWKHVCAR